MSIKISFMHYSSYIAWTRVKLPVVFEEFDIVYIFCFLFLFHYYCQLVKSQLQWRPENPLSKPTEDTEFDVSWVGMLL